jgi:glycosyltransferase involved in cell wall biosynthesis
VTGHDLDDNRCDPHRVMRILQVIHQFPPFSAQGSEMHCLHLSRALAKRGDSVGVFHISNTTPRHPPRLETREDGGIRLFHCVDDGHYSRVADWPNPFLQTSFRQVLSEYAADVVHFHNYLSLGDDLVGIAHATGAGVVYTLHDYGLICPNNLLLRPDGGLCEKSDPDFFQDCCPQTIRCSGGRTPMVARRLPPLFRWQRFAANQTAIVPRAALAGLVGLATGVLGRPEDTAIDAKREFYFDHTRRVFSRTHLFIAPSVYLRDRFLRCGLDPERIVHERYGIRHFPRPDHLRAANGTIRFGYIGAFHEHKGIGVLLQAFSGLGDRATLHLHGSSFGSPVSEAHFRRITSAPASGIVVHGRYDNERLGEILGSLDAIVVPSVWYENSPLTIQEAQVAGVPVITSGAGGMAELVRDGIDGLVFRLGDAGDLRRVLQSIIDRPGQLTEMRRRAPPVPTIEAQSERIRGHYEAAIGRARA